MKNNQFKKEIRKIIENECETFDFQSVYVDESKNTRVIYIYTNEWKYVGIFRLWLNSDTVHLSFTNLKTLSLFQHKVKEAEVKYFNFDKIVQAITEAFDIMDRTES